MANEVKHCCEISEQWTKDRSKFYAQYPDACDICGGHGIVGYENDTGVAVYCSNCEEDIDDPRCALCGKTFPIDDEERPCDCSRDIGFPDYPGCGCEYEDDEFEV